MFYESIVHSVIDVENAEQAAKLIFSGNVLSYQALKWNSENGVFFAVSDSHIDDNSFAETAIIKQIENDFIRIETLTVAWMDSEAEVIRYFKESETSTLKVSTSLIIGKATNQTANFTCSCCGTWFNSNVSYQLKFDKDNGYGLCKSCEKYG